MIKFLRSQSQTVLVIVLGAIGLGMLFYGSSGNLLTSTGGRVSNDYGRIDGTDLSVADLYDAIHETRYAMILEGRSQELSQTGSSARVAEDAWAQLLLKSEADRLHIQVSDDEVTEAIRKESLFQKDGSFDPDTYKSCMARLQGMLRIPADSGPDPLQSTEEVFENFVRNTIRTGAVSKAILATVRGSAEDVTTKYEQYYGPAAIDVVTFDPKAYADQVQITPDDIAAEYKAHPEKPAYRSPEKRKVDYVLFQLTPDQQKLADKDKDAAKQALAEQAGEFAIALQPEPTAAGTAPPPAPDFATEAKKRGLTPETTDFFAADTPPANIPPSPAFNNSAFALTKDNTVSKVVYLDNGVAVQHLVEIQPSELLPIDQVKDAISKELQVSKSVQAAQVNAQTTGKLLSSLGKGGDFKSIVAGMHLKVDTLPAFVPAVSSSSTNQRLRAIASVVTTLQPGQISDPVPIESDNTFVIVHVESRAKADPSGLAQFETQYRESMDDQIRRVVYSDWIDWKSKQPGTHKPPELDLYGGIE